MATVSDNGIVTGQHVGTTIITAKSDNGKAECEVVVKAKYNTYLEPVFEFGAIKSKENRVLDVEKEESLLFKPDKSSIQGVGYLFKNGKMTSIGVNVKTSSSLEAIKFLIERYLVVGAGMGDIVGLMLNNLPSKATMSIGIMGLNTDCGMRTIWGNQREVPITSDFEGW